MRRRHCSCPANEVREENHWTDAGMNCTLNMLPRGGSTRDLSEVHADTSLEPYTARGTPPQNTTQCLVPEVHPLHFFLWLTPPLSSFNTTRTFTGDRTETRLEHLTPNPVPTGILLQPFWRTPLPPSKQNCWRVQEFSEGIWTWGYYPMSNSARVFPSVLHLSVATTIFVEAATSYSVGRGAGGTRTASSS